MRHRLVAFSQGSLVADESKARDLADPRFSIAIRETTADDWARADAAGEAGRAGGMSLLARRCRVVWEIASDAEDAALWTFAATLAGALLGPILPADEATLVGVRGARLRAERGQVKS